MGGNALQTDAGRRERNPVFSAVDRLKLLPGWRHVEKGFKPVFYLAVLGVAFALPWIGVKKYPLVMLTQALYWSMAAVSLNLVLGYTGQASLAHGAFMGIGAYAFGIFAERVGLNFWPSLLLAGSVTALLGFLIGLPSLRTKGPYFAIVTLCFNVIVYKVFENWTWLSGGIQGQTVTRPSFLEQRWAMYCFVLAALALTLLLVRFIVKSVLGVTFMSVRSNENLAEAVGINAFRYKLLSFTVSCFIVGMAGALMAVEKGHVDSTLTHYTYSFNLLVYVLVGGAATLSGPVVGAVGLFYLLHYLEETLGEYRYVLFGLILILVITFFNRGVAGGLERLWNWVKDRYRRDHVREVGP